MAALVAATTGCGRSDGTKEPAASAPPPTASGPAVPSPTISAPSAPSGPQRFQAQIKRVARTTLKYSWHKGCPVPPAKLRLIEMTYWGMDDRAHSGQLVVNASAAKDIVGAFGKLYGQRYPIRRMELVDVYKGSDNDSIEADNTSAFNCRNATGSSSWSQHAYGLAIDINPCENPYVTADGKVSHKDCVKFKDRSRRDPGLIHKGDKVVRTFAAIGWSWGGEWSGTKDYQHFSSTGR